MISLGVEHLNTEIDISCPYDIIDMKGRDAKCYNWQKSFSQSSVLPEMCPFKRYVGQLLDASWLVSALK